MQTAGYVVVRQRPATAKGILFMSLEDESGLLNIMAKPARYAALQDVLHGEALLFVTGVVQRSGRAVSLLVEEASPFSLHHRRRVTKSTPMIYAPAHISTRVPSPRSSANRSTAAHRQRALHRHPYRLEDRDLLRRRATAMRPSNTSPISPATCSGV